MLCADQTALRDPDGASGYFKAADPAVCQPVMSYLRFGLLDSPRVYTFFEVSPMISNLFKLCVEKYGGFKHVVSILAVRFHLTPSNFTLFVLLDFVVKILRKPAEIAFNQGGWDMLGYTMRDELFMQIKSQTRPNDFVKELEAMTDDDQSIRVKMMAAQSLVCCCDSHPDTLF